MSRDKVNSGWIFGVDTHSLTAEIEGQLSDFIQLLNGNDLRNSIASNIVLDNADYFVERLLIWGELFYNPANVLQRSASMCSVRVGTVNDEFHIELQEELLFTSEQTEFWGRVLQDDMVPCYRFPQISFDGAALVVDAAATADSVQLNWPLFGEARFKYDIQQRFSLQRQQDELVVAFSPHPEYFAEGDVYTCTIAWKALVKEYRR